MSNIDDHPVSDTERRLADTLDMFVFGVQLVRERLRREDPDAADALIEERVAEWLHREDPPRWPFRVQSSTCRDPE